MKNLIIIFAISICVLAFQNSYSQTKKEITSAQPGDYIVNDSLAKYEGSWQFKNEHSLFQVVLKVAKHQPIGRGSKIFYLDMIVGGYTFTKDGQKVINTMADIDTNPKITGILNQGDKRILLNFIDTLKSKTLVAEFTIRNKNSASWKVRDKTERPLMSMKKFDPAISVPLALTLTKMKN